MTTRTMAYPIGTEIKVFHDDGNWDRYSAWWMRPIHEAEDLFVCRYKLATDEDDEYCGDWEADSRYLLSEHPDCVFVYASN